jgi:hypothetical protein
VPAQEIVVLNRWADETVRMLLDQLGAHVIRRVLMRDATAKKHTVTTS